VPHHPVPHHPVPHHPGASFTWQTYEVPRDDLRSAAQLPEHWDAHVWQCVQRPSELLWVPDLQCVRPRRSRLVHIARTRPNVWRGMPC
jgi:hypothetical protein